MNKNSELADVTITVPRGDILTRLVQRGPVVMGADPSAAILAIIHESIVRNLPSQPVSAEEAAQ